MSVDEFVQETLENGKEELAKLRKLQEILDQISPRRDRAYIFSVSSNIE